MARMCFGIGFVLFFDSSHSEMPSSLAKADTGRYGCAHFSLAEALGCPTTEF